MTAEEVEAKLTEIIKLSKELGYEVGVMLDSEEQENNIIGIVIGNRTFVQSAIEYMQLDSFVKELIEPVKQLPEPKHKVSDIKKPEHKPPKSGSNDDDGGNTWH